MDHALLLVPTGARKGSSSRVEQRTGERKGRDGGHDREHDNRDLSRRIASSSQCALLRALLSQAERTSSIRS